MTTPTVTVAIPVLNEEAHLASCLAAVAAQTYPAVVEVLVVDGGSDDRTVPIAKGAPGVRVLSNPRRIQSAALNVALAAAVGEILVRVDGHCVIEPDYVERAVAALAETGAAMVGGAMMPRSQGTVQRAVAAAMSSPTGAGPARFHVGGVAGWVDTVYLGAYRTAVAREVGGYAEDVGVNEDAEFAIRMAPHGGIWFDPGIRSEYEPRNSLRSVSRQFYRYGLSRAATIRRHPRATAPRQLAAPLFLASLLTPVRRQVLPLYAALVLASGIRAKAEVDLRAKLVLLVLLPLMHVSWGVGFYVGLARALTGRPPL